MATYRARALALRKTRLGESDLIVTLLAADGCQIRAVAKGARKTTSRFGARLEPFSVTDLLLARGRSLDIITEAECVASHEALRTDYDRTTAASVVADFLDKVSVECQAEEQLFPLGVTTLAVMESAEIDALPALVAAFLVKGMAMHGYRPQLGACAACGEPFSAGRAAAKRFSLDAGGILCAECVGADPAALKVSAELAETLTLLLRSKMSDVAGAALQAAKVKEALVVVRAFVGYHVPARMKALEMYVGGMQ